MTWDMRPCIASMDVLELKKRSYKAANMHIIIKKIALQTFLVPLRMTIVFGTTSYFGIMIN